MPDTKSKISLESAPETGTRLPPRSLKIVSKDVPQMQTVMKMMSLQMRPRFEAKNEPKLTSKTYKDVNGNSWYAPTAELAKIDGTELPAVEFLQSEGGTTHLQVSVDLSGPPGASGAQMLSPEVEHASIQFTDGSLTLPAPTTNFGPDGAELDFIAVVPDNILPALVEAMKHDGAIRLKIGLLVHYELTSNQNNGGGGPTPGNGGFVPGGVVFKPGDLEKRRLKKLRFLALREKKRRKKKLRRGITAQPRPARANLGTTARGGSSTFISARPDIVADLSRFEGVTIQDKSLKTFEGMVLDKNILDIIGGKTQPDPQTPPSITPKSRSFQQALNFMFPEGDSKSLHIYQHLDGGNVDALGKGWHISEHGIFAAADYPNAFYLIPHELRIAYNAEAGLPDILPVLYMSDEDEPRVRVRIGIEPWYDSLKAGRLRRELPLIDSEAFMYPDMLNNFSAPVLVQLQTQFPDGIERLGDIETESLGFHAPFALNLDVTLEYYRFLTTLLTGPTGLTGVMTVTLAGDTEPDDDEADISALPEVDQATIPFALKLSKMGQLPLDISALPTDDEMKRPTSVRVVNRSAHQVTFAGGLGGYIYQDDNSFRPVNFFDVDLTNPMPIVLEPGASADIETDLPEEAESSIWNALDVVLGDYSTVIDPEEALRHAHDLSPPGSFTLNLSVQSPPLMTSPDDFTELFALMVEIHIPGRSPVTVRLDRDTPEDSLILTPTLDELVSTDVSSQSLAYSYRTRTILTTGERPWSALQDGFGSHIFAFPDMPPDDT